MCAETETGIEIHTNSRLAEKGQTSQKRAGMGKEEVWVSHYSLQWILKCFGNRVLTKVIWCWSLDHIYFNYLKTGCFMLVSRVIYILQNCILCFRPFFFICLVCDRPWQTGWRLGSIHGSVRSITQTVWLPLTKLHGLMAHGWDCIWVHWGKGQRAIFVFWPVFSSPNHIWQQPGLMSAFVKF